MSRLRPELEIVVRTLLEGSEGTGEVSLDAVGEAIGLRAISPDDVEAIFGELERHDRRVVGPSGGGGEERLGRVVETARVLVGELGRRPTVVEIAVRSGLPIADVRQALALARVIQR